MADAPAKLTFRSLWVCLILVQVTAAIYGQLRHAPFTVYDDEQYVSDNDAVKAGLNWSGVKWAFSGGHEANWHPVTWLSHMVDCSLFGLEAGKHHLVNVAIHTVNSLLLFGLLRYLTGAFWRSAIVAALFAWHPMHVESVAWIAERKDVLSTFFWFLALLAYTTYCRSLGPRKRVRPILLYLLICVLFSLGLMSKPMVVTLPFQLLLLDYWPIKRRESWWFLALEKIPLMAMSAICCWITFKVQSNDHAVNLLVPFGVRLASALIAYVRYVGKLFWPIKLAVYYPYDFNPPEWQTACAVVILLAISTVAIYFWQRRPYLLIGWLWFLGTLVPTIGMVQVGKQSMADRYAYVPAVGLFLAVVWLIGEIVSKRPVLKNWAAGFVVLLLAGYARAAYVQAGYWQSSDRLFTHCLDVTPDNAVVQFNLAYNLFEQKKYAEAAVHYQRSLEMEPEQAGSECNLALCLSRNGRDQEAIPHFEKALQLKSDDWVMHLDYGLSLVAVGNPEGAIEQYQAAIRLNPEAYRAHYSLANLYFEQRRYNEAEPEYAETVRLAPKEAMAHRKLADTLNLLGQTQAAVAEYQETLQLNPSDLISLNDLAWIRAANADPALRDGAEAVRLARQACELSKYQEPFLIGTLAAAYAEAGQFAEAQIEAKKARNLALAHHLPEVAAKNEELLKRYQARQPYHEVKRLDAP